MAISFFKDEEEKKKYLEELQERQKEYARQEEERRLEAIKDVEWVNPQTTWEKVQNLAPNTSDEFVMPNTSNTGSTWDRIQQTSQNNNIEIPKFTQNVEAPKSNNSNVNTLNNMNSVRMTALQNTQNETKKFREGIKQNAVLLTQDEQKNLKVYDYKAWEKAERYAKQAEKGDYSFLVEKIGDDILAGGQKAIGGLINAGSAVLQGATRLVGAEDATNELMKFSDDITSTMNRAGETRELLQQRLKEQGKGGFLNDALKFGGDITESVSNTLMAGAMGGGTGTVIPMGVSAGGNAFAERQKENNNQDYAENLVASTFEGVWNGLWEKATGGNFITKKTATNALGETVVENTGWLDKWLFKGLNKAGIKNPKVLNVINKAWQYGGEVVEEVGTDLTTAITNDLIADEDFNENFNATKEGQTVLQTLVSTFVLSKIGLGGVDTETLAKQYNLDTNEVNKVKKSVDTYIDEHNANITKENMGKAMNQFFENEGIDIDFQQIANTENTDNNQSLNQYSLEENANNSAFKYEKSDNAKIDAFRQEASNLLNDSEATHNFAQVIEKVIEDKNYNVRLNPNLTDSNGNIANGTIKTLDNGEVEITLNPNSKRAGEFILTHEITHAIATDEMRTLVNDYMQKDAKFADAVKNLQQVYNTNEINDEVLADVSGQLFGNQEFINQLSMEKPNVFKRFYNKIIELANKITGNSNESLFIKDLKNKWEEAYRNNYNNLDGTHYFFDNVDYFDEMEYNSSVAEQVDPKTWKAIDEAIGREDLKSGVYETEAFDYADDMWKRYMIYYKSKGDYKIVNSQPVDENSYTKGANNESNRYSKEISTRDDKSGSIRESDSRNNGEINNGEKTAGISELLNTNEEHSNTNRKNNVEISRNSQSVESQEGSFNLPTTDNQGNEINPAMQKRMEKSQARNEDGELKVLYHGSPQGEFTVFDKNRASVESDWGAGFYLTDNEYDVADNYEDGGQDFENKVSRLAEQIEQDSDMTYEEAKEEARKQLYKGSYLITAYADIENPAIVGETRLFNQEDYLDNYNIEDYESEEEYYEDVDRLVADDIDSAIWAIEREYDIEREADNIRNILYDAVYDGGIEIQELKDKLNEIEVYDGEGNLANNDVARIIIESQGYDGIIDPTVSGKWNMNMDDGTTHYICFKPNQIKNIDNENPTDNPDIRYSKSEENWQNYIENKFDNQGRKLSKQQQEYFKDSKARDENGNLATVYHTTTDRVPQFNEFDPTNTQYYRFGDQIVNYYTDSQEMSSSYSNDPFYEKADSTRIENFKDAKKWLDNYKEDHYTRYDYEIKEEDGKLKLTRYELGKNYEREEAKTINTTYKNLITDFIKLNGGWHNLQYEGYANITNPYIVDANYSDWNKIEVENLKELKQKIKEKWDTPQKRLDSLKGDTLKELNKDLNKLGYQLKEDYYGDLGIFTKSGQLAIDVTNVNDVMEEIREDLDSDLNTPISTNDIVFQALAENENGANYDGVIIKNVIDYGQGQTSNEPANLYVTFNSNQFKAKDNMNPTSDADWRYSKDNLSWREYLESKFKASGTRTKLEDIKLPVKENVETKLPVNEEAVKKNTSNNNRIVENTKDFFNKEMYNELTSNKDMFEGVTESELKEGLKQLYEVQLDDELKTGNYKEDNSRKRTYMRYKNAITEYNKDVLNIALDRVKANRNDRRTVNQWLDVAKQIGQNSGDLNAKQIQDLAFGSWFDLKPNTHDSITKYDNVAKERVPYKRLTSDDWVNTIYDNAKQAKLNQFEEALNKQPLIETTQQVETKPANLESITEVEEPKEAVMPIKDKTAEEIKIAKVLSQPVEKQKTAQRAWALIKANLIDKGAVFEDISLKTKNRELQSKWDSTLLSGAKGQYAIGNTRYDFDNGKQTQINKALTDIIDEVGTDADAFQNYMYHQLNVDRMTLQDRFGTENKPVFGDNIGAEYSKQQIAEYEKNYPEFKEYAQDVYDYLDANKQELVKSGVISQELADKFEEMYPHYVPIARVDKNNQSIAVPLDTKRTGVNSPIKKAKGGSQDIQPLFQTIADKTLQTYRASARNSFGVELKNTLDKLNMLNQSNENVDVDTIMDTMNDEEHTGLTEGTKTQNPTFTVFENGEKVTYEINQDMYDALKPKSELLSKIDNSTPAKILNKVSNFRRGVLTEYNPVFSLTNAIKDAQDVLMNSQHATKTYAKFPEAYAQILKKGYWYQEYVQNGGEQNSYFKDGDFEVKDTSAKGKVKSALKMPLETISRVNNVIEMAPRLAEYIASREAGRSVETSMLDASRVTTNFKAGGDITKALNRNGVTFLNASVQGMTQNIRNIREANAKGFKGYAVLAGKTALAGLPALILNNMIWGDDDDYDDLQDYVKDNYYIIGKVGDHQFLRIPKGRVVSVIQKIVSNADEFINNKNELNADELAKSFWKDLQEDFSLAMSNVAPNNPLENNVVSPIKQAVTNKTWYGSDLVPSRLQKKPTKEQYDETTAEISKNISNALNTIGINSNPMAINYILDQYGGGVSDILLPMGTPQAENNVLEDKFTTNSVMKAKYAGDFFSKYDELTVNNNASDASDEDIVKYKYFSSIRGEISKLYQEKREIQNSNQTDEAKKKELEKVQQQINDKTKKALEEVKKPKVSGNTATVGGVDFVKTKNAKTQEYEWEKIGEDDKIDGVSLKTYADYMNKTSEELSKQRKSGEISETGQLKDKDKIQILKNSNYTDSEKKAIYADKIGTNDNLYKTVLNNSSIDIDEYLDYKAQDFEADKNEYGQSISGTAKQKTIDYINNNISGYENRLLLIASKYKLTNAEEKQKLVQWINKQPNKMDIYKQLSNNFLVQENKVYYK